MTWIDLDDLNLKKHWCADSLYGLDHLEFLGVVCMDLSNLNFLEV